MDFKGTIKNITKDILTGRLNITFEVASDAHILNELNDLKEMDALSVKVSKWRRKRSTDANAYCWVLIQKIAEAVMSDKWSVYLEMLKKYSRDFTFVICKENAIDRLQEMYRTCVDFGEINVNGVVGHQIQVFFGSSTFDSKSMSVFIDGIISECKELGIETMTPAELERIKKEWNNGRR
jgi:hypothetical protein